MQNETERPSDFKREKIEAEITILESEDWQSFKELRLQALKTDPTAFGRSYEEEANLSEEEWRKKVSRENSQMYGAKIEQKLIGMTGVRFEIGERIGHMATIIGVFVNPAYRGQGVGEKLMAKVLEDLHANERTAKVRLSVNESQEPAKRMYQKLGFKEIGIARKEIKVGDVYYDQAQMEFIFEDKL